MTTTLRERRARTLTEAAGRLTRAEGDGAAPTFVGYAAKFNERTAIGNPASWGFYEQIAPGAFSKTLKEGDARFLVDHDTRMIVARVSAGDLRLAEDGTGLTVEADLDPELSYVRDLVRNLEARRVTGMSFAFDVIRDEWDLVDVGELDDGTPIQAELRTLLEVRLPEVSAVTFPAYESTEAALRSVGTALDRRGDLDAIARRVASKPELADYTHPDRAPAETTRGHHGETGPAETTRSHADRERSMRGLAALHGLAPTG